MQRPLSSLVASLMLFGFLAAGVIALSMIETRHSSVESISRYISVWEDEIARGLLLKQDSGLFEKVRLQVRDIAPDVESATPSSAPRLAGECFLNQTVDLSLYGTPAGALTICRSPSRFIVRSLLAPVFGLGLLIAAALSALAYQWLEGRRRRDESAMANMQVELATAKAVGQLAKQVAHDIRAPLSALKTLATTLPQGPLTGAHLELFHGASKRITLIADDLLDRSRKAEAKTTVVQESVRAVVLEAQALSNVPITLDSHSDEPLQIGAPAIEYERVISNLLQNAIEAVAKTSEPSISLGIDRHGEHAALSIADNGVGIAADLIDRVGVSGFSYGKDRGHGLGVASARAFAKRLGGELEIQSSPGNGTRVRLLVPMV